MHAQTKRTEHKTSDGTAYWIWFDHSGVRWALQDWPDDGIGLQRYGRSPNLFHARSAIERSHARWRSVRL